MTTYVTGPAMMGRMVTGSVITGIVAFPLFALDTSGNLTAAGLNWFDINGNPLPATPADGTTYTLGSTVLALGAGAAIANLGYVPANKAGDTITGSFVVNGNTGFGTATPITKIHSRSAALPTSVGSVYNLFIDGASDTGNFDGVVDISDRFAVGSDWTSVRRRLVRVVGSSEIAGFELGNQTAGSFTPYLAMRVNAVEAMRVLPSGAIGFGTATPIKKYTFNGAVTFQAPADGAALDIQGRASDNTGSIRFVSSDYTQELAILQQYAGDTYLRNEAGGSVILGTNGLNRLQIDNAGQVHAFVAPGGGEHNDKVPTAAWVLDNVGFKGVNIMAFGGVADGTTDNVAAWNAAKAASQAKGFTSIVFPPGNFFFSGPITASALGGTDAIGIFGSGMNRTKLLFSSGAQGMALTLNSAYNSVEASGFSVLTQGTSSSTIGIYVHQAGSVPNPANTALSVFRDVMIRGADGYAATDYWGACFQIDGVSNINFDGCHAIGPGGAAYSTAGNGFVLATTSANVPVVFNFNNCIINYLNAGLLINDKVQGVTLNGTNVTACSYGVFTPGGASQIDELVISGGCQLNCRVACVQTGTYVSGLNIIGNFFITANGGNAINLLQYQNTSILGNSFTCLDTTHATNGVYLVAPSGKAVVSGNTFNGMSVGVWCDTGSTGVKVNNNGYYLCTTEVHDIGTGNQIGVASN